MNMSHETNTVTVKYNTFIQVFLNIVAIVVIGLRRHALTVQVAGDAEIQLLVFIDIGGLKNNQSESHLRIISFDHTALIPLSSMSSLHVP